MGVEIALAVGLEGVIASLVGAGINAAAGLGISYAAQKLTGAQSNASAGVGGSSGVQASLTVGADTPRVAILGETAYAGTLVYWHLSGGDNDTLYMVIALADHECDGLSGAIVDGLRRTVAQDGTVEGYNGKLRVKFYSGAPGQVADAEVIATSAGRWTANERGVGVCYAVVVATYDEALFPGGIPRVQFIVRGAKLLDPRTNTTAYSDNWGVAVYNVLRGIRQTPGGLPVVGLNALPGSIRLPDVVAACNISDELVATAVGNQERRYRVGAVLFSNQTTRDHLEYLLAAAAGQISESAGIYRVFAGAAQPPVVELTDADLIVTQPFSVARKRTRANLVNTVEGSFLDPRQGYVSVALPPRVSDVDVAADGGNGLTRALELAACPSPTQGQRVMEIERRRARRQLTATCTVRAGRLAVEVGDWIAFTSARQGWNYRLFEVVAAPRSPDLTASLTLAEVDDAIDDWTIADEIGAGEVVSLPSGGPTLTAVSGIALNFFVAQSVGGAQRPGLRISWAPITDPTVTGLRLQFRRVGDETVNELAIFDALAGAFSWLSGVLGETAYEARLQLVTSPARGVDWSPWVSTPVATVSEPIVVDVAAFAENVNPANLPPAELSAQEKFELGLVTTGDLVGSLSAAQTQALQGAQTAAEAAILADLRARNAETGVKVEERTRQSATAALAQQITDVQALLSADIAASVTTERTARVAEDTALAASIDTLTTTVGGHTASIQVLTQATDGIGARFSVSLSQDGYATGFITLDQTQSVTTFGVLADKFFVAQPGIAGGAPVNVFTIGNVAGVPSIGINGSLVIDGTLTTRHLAAGAITAEKLDVNNIVFRKAASADGTSFIDFTPGNRRLRIVA